MLDWQSLIVLLAVLAAAVYVALRLRAMVSSRSSGCGCDHCPGSAQCSANPVGQAPRA